MEFTEPRDAPGLAASGVRCSVGIMAYNEEANIADAIGAILGQKLGTGHIAELIVVASGCEDRTVPIVSDIVAHDPRVRLIEQERREGKASAINLFISAASSPVLVMVSADVLVEEGTIDALLRHFEDATVGMVEDIRSRSTARRPSWATRSTCSGACTTGSPANRRSSARSSPSAMSCRASRTTRRWTRSRSRR